MLNLPRIHRAVPEQEEQRGPSCDDPCVERRKRFPEVCQDKLQRGEEAEYDTQRSYAGAFAAVWSFERRGETKSLRVYFHKFLFSTRNS